MFHQIKWKAENSYAELQKLKNTLDAEFQKTKGAVLSEKLHELGELVRAETQEELHGTKDDDSDGTFDA